MIEREIKVRVDDLAVIRERIVQAGGSLVHALGREHNVLFDRGGELRQTECLLRLRRDPQGARITFKGPASFDGPVKQRTEMETAVADPSALESMLVALGFEASWIYEKDREEWRLGDALVALDVTPLGAFVEVEAPDPLPALERLMLEKLEPEVLSYPGLWEQARASDASLAENMVFSEA